MVHPLSLRCVARLCAVFSKSRWGKEEEEGELDPYLEVLAVGVLTGHQAQNGQWLVHFLSPFRLHQNRIRLLRNVRIWLLSARQLALELRAPQQAHEPYSFETHVRLIHLSLVQNIQW